MAGYGRLVSNFAWEDLNFPIIMRSTGSTIATYTAIDTGGLLLYPQWQENDYHVCDANELPHSWAEGTSISWHLHMITNGQEASNKFVKWELTWAAAKPSTALAEQTTITTDDFTIPSGTATKTHFIVPIGVVAMTGYTIGTHIYPRLKRVTATGAAPAANPWVTMLQAHIQNDTIGSSQVTSK